MKRTGPAGTPASEWLIGGGEMGELIRSRDWSATPFGPRASWPAPLRTVVNLLVGSQFPMALLWGPDLLLLYNDAYREIAGERHPGALGRSSRAVWPEVWAINEPIFAAVMDRGEATYLEDEAFPIVRQGRREDAYFTLSYSPVRAEDGAVAGTLVTLLETTRRVRQHREQEQRLRVSFEHVALGIIEVGLDARILNVNHTAAALLGYEPGELVGMGIQQLTAPEDRDNSRELNGRLLRGELDTFQYEKRYLKKSGTPIWVRVIVSAIRDAAGAVVGAVRTVEDITERKRAQDELSLERTVLRGLFDNIPVLLVRWDPRLERFELNRTAESVLGWSTAEANAGDLMSLVYPDPEYRAEVAAYMRSMQTGFREWWVATRGGERIPVEWANIGLSDGTSLGIGVDLRERRRSEEALRAALAKAEAGDRMLAALMNHVPEGITICDAQGKLQAVSRHGQDLLGGPHAGKSIEQVAREWAVYRPESREPMALDELPLSRALKGETVQDFELVEVNSEGRELPLLCDAAPIRDASGQIHGAIVAWSDITERKRAEAALRRSEERMRLAQQVAGIGSFEFYPRTNTSKWSPELEALYGLPPGGYVGTREQWAALVHPDDLQAVERCLAEALVKGTFEAEWRILRPDGSKRWISGRGRTYLDDTGRPALLLGVNMDITERKRNEEVLRESEQRNRLFLDELPSGLIVADLATGMLRWNKAALAMHGYQADGEAHAFLESMPSEYELFSLDRVPLPVERWPVSRLLAGESFRDQEVLARHRRHGWERAFSLSGVIVHEPGNRATGLLAIHDVTERKRTERELRRSEAKFRSVFEQSATGMGQVRFADARFIDVNDAFCRMLGRSREDLLSRPWPEITHPDDLERDLVPFRRMASGELESYTLEKRLIHRQGHAVWARLTLSLVRDAQGRPDYEIAVIEDITERKHAETALRESEERFRSVVENMSEGLMFFDERSNLVYQNPASLRIHGFEPGREGRIGQEDLPVTWNAWDEGGRPITFDEWPVSRVFRRERFHSQVLHVQRAETGQEFDGSYNGSPIYDAAGNLVAGFITIRDITEERRAERALVTANERLLDADKRKNDFLAMLSHELRNPLAPIKNSLYILDRAVPGGQQAKRAQEVIDRQVQHMTRLIDDLLDVTRISRGKIHLQRERLELCDLVRRTAEDHRAVFERAGVALTVETCPGPLQVKGDPTRLAQTIGNLLGNAVKFTPRGGSVELRLSSEQGRASVHVRDDGAGIDPDLLNKLFQPFVQADATLDRSKGGLGLGLALVKGLVELHGGSVSARSEGAGRGAEFVVTLPLDSEAGAAARRESGRGRPAARLLRVLLIEDNVDAAQTLKEALELNGHEIAVAANGLEGIEMARTFEPDVVLCDIGLPGIDGFEVARRMRADPSLGKACLVALSGYAAPEDVARSREAGFLSHLAKPPDIAALQSTITEACGGVRPSGGLDA